LTNNGTVSELQAQIDWLSSLPHQQKIVIAGNHDSFFDRRVRRKQDHGSTLNWGSIHYLDCSSVSLAFPDRNQRKLNVYGAPQIPACGGDDADFAFQYDRTEDHWTETIPMDTDILVTHTPPAHHLDLNGLGCLFLLREVWRVRPRLHVFGHVHAGSGMEYAWWDESQQLYEKVMQRSRGGMLREFLALRSWLDIIRLVFYGLKGVLWSRVWGGGDGGGMFINASLAYLDTGRLDNKPKVVDV
jgi:hypothetical protein